MYASSRRQLHRFPNRIFVESGTYLGEGVEDALSSGFQKVLSFEVVESLVERARTKFADRGNDVVDIIQDTSANMFPYIESIHEPITFWLDGHWSNNEETGFKDVYCPILLELDAIAKHSIKTHSILIDDVRLFGTWEFDHISVETVIKKLLEINPAYKIEFLDGYCPKDILCASIQ